MKKTLIVLMMVLLAAVLIVSCDDSTNDSGTTTYEVGDTGPAGGTIFYVNPNASTDGWTYLEAGKSDYASFSGGASVNCYWGPKEAVDCKTTTGIGEGLDNTKKLYDKGENYEAAYKVYDNDIYENGFKDWFVPSKEELSCLMNNSALADSFASDTFYWSSSETYEYNDGSVTDTAYAIKIVINGLSISPQDRNNPYLVRPVRRFN